MERNDDVTRQLQPLVDDDAFIDELARGVDPSNGKDELAGLLLELREEVYADIPPTPIVEGAAEQEAGVIPMSAGRPSRPWLHGLIGAAAATVLLAGAGAVYVNSVQTTQEPTVVDLASKLDEIDDRAAEGDVQGARELVAEARDLLRELEAAGDENSTAPSTQTDSAVPRSVTATATATATATVTETAPAPEPAPEPEAPVTTTVVEPTVVTSTAIVTVTEYQQAPPVRENPLPEPAQQPDPDSGGQEAPVLAPPQVQE